MKITINTTDKTISVYESISLKEFFNFLEDVVKDWKDYDLLVEPVTVRIKERVLRPSEHNPPINFPQVIPMTPYHTIPQPYPTEPLRPWAGEELGDPYPVGVPKPWKGMDFWHLITT